MSFAKALTPSRAATFTWLALVALTIITFAVGEAGMGGKAVMLGVLAVTLTKGQMVVSQFMGLSRVKLPWRLLMGGWLALVGGLIALAYCL